MEVRDCGGTWNFAVVRENVTACGCNCTWKYGHRHTQKCVSVVQKLWKKTLKCNGDSNNLRMYMNWLHKIQNVHEFTWLNICTDIEVNLARHGINHDWCDLSRMQSYVRMQQYVVVIVRGNMVVWYSQTCVCYRCYGNTVWKLSYNLIREFKDREDMPFVWDLAGNPCQFSIHYITEINQRRMQEWFITGVSGSRASNRRNSLNQATLVSSAILSTRKWINVRIEEWVITGVNGSCVSTESWVACCVHTLKILILIDHINKKFLNDSLNNQSGE